MSETLGTASTTPFVLINLALKKAGIIGIGQNAEPEDVNDAFFEMQAMLAQWQQRRWLIYHLIDVACVSTGAQSYTVGPGGMFNCLRPDTIEAAFFRQYATNPQPVDFPFSIIQAREDYDRITLKSLGSYPRFLFYDSSYPMGNALFTPIPQSGQFEMHISIKENLGALTSLAQTLNLPPEYQQPIVYNLAMLLKASYGLPADPTINAIAAAGLETIRNANAQVPMLTLPNIIGGAGWYNPYSDQTN